MRRRLFKIVLDIIMLVLLVLMFKKNVISMSFHEIGGLALIGLFVIHNFVNIKWIKAVFRSFFIAKLSGRTRTSAIINLFLAVVFILIGVSGVFMLYGMAGLWKTIHYFCAGISIILMGVHLGLHWGLIKNVFVKHRVNKAVSTVLLIAVIVYGINGIVSTSFVRWLTMPFLVSEHSDVGNEVMHKPSNETGEEKDVDGITAATQSGNNNVQKGSAPVDGNHSKDGKISASNIFTTITSYFSIIILFAFITVIISNLYNNMKKRESTSDSEEYIIGECIEK